MNRTVIAVLAATLLLSFVPPSFAAGAVRVLAINGPITSVTAGYLRRNLHEAAKERDALVLLEMDTPGGLDLAMRDIVKAVLESPVPVAVYVTPGGARAASAGAVIALAADVCAMTPGTAIGAAHPVTLGGKQDRVTGEKVLNDAVAHVEGLAARRGRNVTVAAQMVKESLSLPADRAVALKIADLLAADRADLLAKLDGFAVTRVGGKVALRTRGAPLAPRGMTTAEKILDAVSNPNVAYILMMLGFLGLFVELTTPGVILPGVMGGISLILALFAFQSLPVNYAGVLLILLALALFFAEIQIISHGILAIGGIVSLIFGSLFLFQSSEPYLRLSVGLIAATAGTCAAFFLFVVVMAIRAHRRRPTTGREGLIGETGHALTDLTPEGKVFVRGEYWNAVADEPIRRDEPVSVVSVEGLRVRVVRREGSGRDRPERRPHAF